MHSFFEGFKAGQKKFGEPMATVINSLLLSIVYFIGVGATSLIAKTFGKKFLDLRKDANAKTYWVDMSSAKKTKADYYSQF